MESSLSHPTQRQKNEEKALNIPATTKPAFFSQEELDHIKEKTNQLKTDLENNNLDDAIKRINEINDLNSRNFYDLIGKLTRGLHLAISELDVSSTPTEAENNRARVDLKYVIKVTHDAAAKTLDMTEKAMTCIAEVKQNQEDNETLIDTYLAKNDPDPELAGLLHRLRDNNRANVGHVGELSNLTSEIIIAQNFQDLASQSISKVIDIIKQVESSLITLTQYTTLLKKLSRFGSNGQFDIDSFDSESLKSDIDQLNTISHEHLDQGEVDNLLSSLGF